VGVTDNDWYRFLAARPEVAEVNFWQPSGGREFRILAPGEPFFVKTHYPHNRVVGAVLQRLGTPAGLGGVGVVRRG
jgi:putative restriction endonuclease